MRSISAPDDDRWTRIQDLFFEVLDLDDERRAALLATTDDALRREIEAMLRAHESLDGEEGFPGFGSNGGDRAPDILVGRYLDGYRIRRFLGGGGMGLVYEAEDVRLGRSVALKVLPDHLSLDDRARRRLLQEARAASALNHPSIVTIYEVGSESDVDYIAMELVGGETLADRLAGGLPDEETVLDSARRLASALAVAHAAGVIHRDLKPRNVMVTTSGEVKILDFGLAKRFEVPGGPAGSAEVETMSGVVVGTPAYMAPEQVSGRPADPRTDLFALGCLLYEMLTGEAPFRGETTLELLSAVLRDEPPAPSSRRSSLLPAWDLVVGRLLAKDPDERYPNAEALLVDLEELGARTRSGSGRGWRPTALRVLTATALVGILVVLAWAGWRARVASPGSDGGAAGFPEYRYRLLADLPGSQRHPTLSPDGAMVAFVMEDEGGVPQIWVQGLTGREPIQVTRGDRAATQPDWSPLGDRILFARRGEGIWEVPPLGGSPRQLLEIGMSPTLSPDGDLLVFNRVTRGFGDVLEEGDERRLWIASGDGGEPRPLESFQATHFGFFARGDFSPDGRELAVFWPQPNRPIGDLWIVPVSGEEPRRLTDLGFLSWGTAPVWSPDGRWIVFSSDHTGASNLWRASVDGTILEPITAGSGGNYHADLSSDMRRLVYTNGRTIGEVHVHAPDGGSFRVGHQRRGSLSVPTVSPDGRRIAFFSRTPGAFDLLVADLATGVSRQVTRGAGWVNTIPVWSADGRRLYYYRQGLRDPDPSTYRRIEIDGRNDQELLADWRWTEQSQTSPSPDESRVAYVVRASGKSLETRVRDLETGEETLLPQVLEEPSWTPDGTEIYGVRPLARRIAFCAADGSTCRDVTTGWSARLAPDGRHLYVLRNRPPTVWRHDLDRGSEAELFTVEDFDTPDWGWGVRPGGEVVVHSQRTSELELWVGEAPEEPLGPR